MMQSIKLFNTWERSGLSTDRFVNDYNYDNKPIRIWIQTMGWESAAQMIEQVDEQTNERVNEECSLLAANDLPYSRKNLAGN